MIRLPRRSALALLSFVAAGACTSEDDLDKSLQIPKDFAQVRLLALVGDAQVVDGFVTNGRLAPIAFGDVPSPGLATFRSAHSGDSKAFVSKDGATLARLETKLDKDAVYTLVAWGMDTKVALTLHKETFAPASDKARVRFVAGDPTFEVASAELGGVALGTSPANGAIGAWIDVAPGAPVLEIRTASSLVGRFTLPALKAGDLRTLVLVKGTAFSPSQLVVVSEATNGQFSTQLLDLDGSNRPKAKVRLLHAAANVGVVDAEAGVSVARNLEKKQLATAVDVAIDGKLVVTADGTEVASLDLALEEGKTYTIGLLGNAAPGGTGVKLVPWETSVAPVTEPTARVANALSGLPGTIELADATPTLIFPKTAYQQATDYAVVPAGPTDGTATLEIAFGPNVQRLPVATFTGLTFPADHPSTALLVGAFTPGNPQATPPVPSALEAALMVIDDTTGSILGEVTVTAIAQTPP